MIRRRQLLPDQQVHTQTFGPVPCISDEAFTQAMLDIGAMLRFAGGTAQIITTRHPTDFPSEMLTIHAVIEWKDRTDAKPAPEAAASQASLDAARQRLQEAHEPVLDEEALLEAESEAMARRMSQEEPPPADDPEYEPLEETPDPYERTMPLAGPIGDGLDDGLPEEDVSSIPAELR